MFAIRKKFYDTGLMNNIDSALRTLNIKAKTLENCFRIMDDPNNHVQLMQISPILEFFLLHYAPHRIDLAAEWMVKNGYVGSEFMRWYRQECFCSNIKMFSILNGIVENLPTGAVIMGKDFKA